MNKLTNILVNFALGILKRLVLDKIQYAPVSVFTQSTFVRLKDVAEIVTDNEADNSAQLKRYFEAEKFKLAAEAVSTAKAIVAAEFKNDIAKELVVELLEQVEQALAA